MNHFKYKVGDIVLVPSGRYWVKATIPHPIYLFYIKEIH